MPFDRPSHRHLDNAVRTGHRTRWCPICGAMGTMYQPTSAAYAKWEAEWDRLTAHLGEDDMVDDATQVKLDALKSPRRRWRWKHPRHTAWQYDRF